MSFETAAQRAVFEALDGAISCPVMDTQEQMPEGQPSSAFPYLVLGDDTIASDEADDILGAQVTLTLHIWSRAAGLAEVKALMGEAYDILHRSKPPATGYKTVDCLWEFSTSSTGPDGQTRHGVQRYRLTLHKE